ncbi:AAA family ATPase [Micromonospora sp. NPDC005220]|uniref:AAA family ATPase n=1 Tax=Micromonospora sp. NPDC005220 TaxID=3155589 RepID=UPI0033BBCD60
MTTAFRLMAVVLNTTEGEVRYEFPSDLTVLAGPTGVGKTTLLEMIKYGFGGNGLLAKVVEEHVKDVILDVRIGDDRLRLARSVDPNKRKTVRVFDLVARDRLPDHYTEGNTPLLNTRLLSALGLPDEMRAAARSGNSSRAGNRITFSDIFSFLYIPQAEINRDIASSQDSYLEPKRKAVFELLFGLTDEHVLELRSKRNLLNEKITVAERENVAIRTFLSDSNTTARIDAEAAITAAVNAQREAEAQLTSLREELNPVADRQTQVLRDLLTDAERALAEVRATMATLNRSQTDYARERRRLQGDLDRLRRMRDAGHRLANFEFAICPRCMQSLTDRQVTEGNCRVCLQPDPVHAVSDDTDPYEARQLQDQLTEVDRQLQTVANQMAATARAEVQRAELVRTLSAQVEDRTQQRISPRLQAFTDAAAKIATAQAQQQLLENVLRQWDRVSDLQDTETALRAERENVKAAIARAEDALADRRNEILGEINREFQETVTSLGIPGIREAALHPSNYLPVLDGEPFATFSPPGGGIRTATQIAYWTSLLSVALRRRDTLYPAFLLIDSPRLALNTAERLSAALYRRLVTQADANRGKVQLIIADNELPREYRRDYDQIDFRYESPTVKTIRHPGPAAVRTLVDAPG